MPVDGSTRQRARSRTRDLLSGTLGKPRFVSERPPALLEHIAYAATGEWTSEREGRRRSAALAYAYLVAIPLATLGYLLAWVSARPARLVTFLVVMGTTYLALRGIPAMVSGWGQWPR